MVRASNCYYSNVATAPASIPASADTVKSEERQMKQSGIKYCKKILLDIV
jgi:hypothetical protein